MKLRSHFQADFDRAATANSAMTGDLPEAIHILQGELIPDVQRVESMNSILLTMVRRAPVISDRLLSDSQLHISVECLTHLRIIESL